MSKFLLILGGGLAGVALVAALNRTAFGKTILG